MAKLTIKQQIEALSSLGQGALAHLLRVDVRTLRNNPELPQKANGTYDGAAAVEWWIEHKAPRISVTPAEDGDERQKEDLRWKKARADELELKLAERLGDVVSVDLVRDRLQNLAARLRRAQETIQRQSAPAAATFARAIEEFERGIDEDFGFQESDDADGETADPRILQVFDDQEAEDLD